MTNLVRTELEATIAADLPDNTEQVITAVRLRSACTDLNDTIFREDAIALEDKTGRIMLQQGGYLLRDGVAPDPLADIKTDMVLWWEMELSLSDLGQDSHASNDMTNVGADRESGKVGYAAEFLGTAAAYMSIASPGNDLKFTGDKTIAFWYKHVTGGSVQENLMGIDDGSTGIGQEWRIITFSGDERPYFYLRDSAYTSTGLRFTDTGLSNGTWYHMVATWDSTNQLKETYLDAVSYGTQATTGTMNTSSSTAFHMGKRAASSPVAYLTGMLDEVGMWDRLLTTDEIDALYNSGSGVGYGDLP